MNLTSFQPGANVVVIGASGGIGASFCRALAGSESVGVVHALSRSRTEFGDAAIRPSTLDMLDEASLAQAAERVTADGPLDLVIVATGILHRGELQPEKALRDINGDAMLDVLRVNTVGPALVARHFLPLMRRQGKSVFAALSARVGSIDDNRLGGWVSYRASKAALNQTIRTLAIEHARRRADGILAALHPGTVATDLSQPFSSRVPPDKLFTPETAADHLLRVIDNLTPDDTGGFFA
ncbi:MAG: SDR family NAD(P)-dependent oxidoreductase [Gammaproteobacteria bacterium]|nr:SDR family NAD(P)-dependent oxidoreductase [Gammaproteobacteria bacterium]